MPEKNTPSFPCPICKQAVPVGQTVCPNPNCKEDLSSLVYFDTLAPNLFAAGLEQLKAGKTAHARQSFEAVAAFDPNHLDAWVILGKLHAQDEDYPNAIRCWEKALAIQDDEPRAAAGIKKARELLNRKVKLRMAIIGGVGLAALMIGLLVGGFLFRPAPTIIAAVTIQPAPTLTPVSLAEILAADPTLARLGIQVASTDGTITLSGQVPDETTRQWILSLARSLAPGAAIQDGQLQVLPTPTPSPTLPPIVENTPTLVPTPEPTPIPPTPTPLATFTPQPSCVITTGMVNGKVFLREGPGMDTPFLEVLMEGQALTLIGPARAGWLPVITRDHAGWVSARWCIQP